MEQSNVETATLLMEIGGNATVAKLIEGPANRQALRWMCLCFTRIG
jgi:hypothetical protein